jgi:hypothetical protein
MIQSRRAGMLAACPHFSSSTDTTPAIARPPSPPGSASKAPSAASLRHRPVSSAAMQSGGACRRRMRRARLRCCRRSWPAGRSRSRSETSRSRSAGSMSPDAKRKSCADVDHQVRTRACLDWRRENVRVLVCADCSRTVLWHSDEAGEWPTVNDGDRSERLLGLLSETIRRGRGIGIRAADASGTTRRASALTTRVGRSGGREGTPVAEPVQKRPGDAGKRCSRRGDRQ